MGDVTQHDAAAVRHVPTREGYDRWSEIYDAEDNPLIAVETAEVHRLLGDLPGLAVADIGCGTGRQSLAMARAGATVTALDFSEGMLAKAKTKPGGDAVTWIAHDLHLPLPLPDKRFDRVTCCLVLEHITDLRPLFSEMGRICRPDGFIVISELHPAMMLRGVTARFTDPRTGQETRPQSRGHIISDFVMAALQSGLRIEHLGEHSVDDALAARSERAAKYLGWPILFVMKLRPGLH